MSSVPPATPHSGWRIALAGQVALSGPDGGVATPRARKARALIAFLACKAERSATRAEIVQILWSDRGRAQGRASLRQCLFELRAEAPGLLSVDGERISLADCTVEGAPTDDGHPGGAGWLSDLDQVDRAFDRWLADRRPAQASDSELGARTLPVSAARAVSRRTFWAVIASVASVSVLVAGVIFGVHQFSSGPKPQVVVLLPWSVVPSDPAMQAQAEGIAAAIRAGAPSARLTVRAPRVGVARDGWALGPGGDWMVRGQVVARRRSNTLAISIQTRAGAVLWSREVESQPKEVSRAGERLADATAGVLLCAVGGPPGVRRSDDVMALLMDTCGKIGAVDTDVSSEALIAAARRLVAAAPDDAYAHGMMAMALALLAESLPTNLQAPMSSEARSQANRALTIDQRTGEAYMALGLLALGRRDFSGAEALFRRGLAAEPDHPSLQTYTADVLSTVGRNAEALVFARRSLALDPTAAYKIATVADYMARTSQMRAALELLDAAERARGRHAVLTGRRVSLLLRGGDPVGARAALERAADVPGYLEAPELARLLRETYAIENPQGPEARGILRELAAGRDGAPGFSDRSVLTLSSLGRTEAALDISTRDLIEPEILFRPAQKAMLLSPRFPEVARRQGLWRYWETTGHWPDICREPGLPWRCAATVKTPSIPG